MKLSALQTELAKIERRRNELQAKISQQAKALYTTLPAKVGLKTVDSLILALAPFASPFLRAKLKRPHGSASGSKSESVSPTAAAANGAAAKVRRGRRRRAFSQEKKVAVQAAFKDGKLTTRAIAEKHGVPFNTLKKWKRQWGLTSSTKARAKK